ncbi:hypothetical protein LCGC14_0888460 [marine sediment metagenome]|uniref:Uncharacterized protein n=1 Tax=marine sediment metagenome TaxID=412755 RepID=A0A0F9S6X3_9ZZZZ
MSYKEQLEAAKKEGLSKQISAKFVEWKEDGQHIVGRLIARIPVQSTLGSGTYNHYLFNTDEGLVKFALGKATDNEAGQVMGKNGVYSITFRGQEKISAGRKLNRFDIIEIEAPIETAVGGQSDIPF